MTIKQKWLNEWRRVGGVWTRPAAKRFYDSVCIGSPNYTSLQVGKYLKKYGTLVDKVRPGGRGHWVQVWVIDSDEYWNDKRV